MLGPSLVVAPWAGALVDRLPLVRVLVASDLLRVFVVAAIPLAYAAGGRTLPVFALVALAFTINCFFLPARSALPPRLVGKDALERANAALVLGGIVATVVGTALGGPVVDRFGPSTALYLDAATYLLSVVALASLLRVGIDAAPAEGAPLRQPGALKDALEGWRLLATHKGARVPVAASVATWIAGGALHVAGTPHVQRGATTVTGIGIVLGALALGAALGTAFRLARGPAEPARALGFGLVGAGLGLVAFAFAPPGWPMTLAAFVTGVFAAPVFFVSESAIQQAVPEGARARVFSGRDFLARAAFLIATAAVAPIVARAGTAVPLAGTGALLAVLGVGLARTRTEST
jgi:MFS family permease